MEKEILIFGHKNPDTDSICSAMVKERLNKKNGYDSSVAVRLGNINKETQYVLNYLNLEAPELKEEVAEGQKVIMVDHNEFNQSIKGIEKAKILGVVDHHRIANFETSDPLYYTARPYGCTSTILFQDFKGKGIEINREEAILMKHLTENGLNSVYLPDIHVFHREDASTDDMIKENRKKEMFEIKNHLQSLKVLKEVYDFYENKRGENK